MLGQDRASRQHNAVSGRKCRIRAGNRAGNDVPGQQKAPGRLPRRGVTRHGDRLDKAGQPGGPVSAVYSPAAACAARSHGASRRHGASSR